MRSSTRTVRGGFRQNSSFPGDVEGLVGDEAERGGVEGGEGSEVVRAKAEKAGLSISGSDNIESSSALISESKEENENRSFLRFRRVEEEVGSRT
jgi:hypothetical protein